MIRDILAPEESGSIMEYADFYVRNQTFITILDARLTKMVNIVLRIGPRRLLDVGCGSGTLLNELGKSDGCDLHGVDAHPTETSDSWSYQQADITRRLPYADGEFDCVVLGEIIEHVPDPDQLLREAHRVLTGDGRLIVSTPNLVSWANRLLVPIGIQPLFTETSTDINLGRRFRILGQGGKVQGHLKIFTHRSLAEILEKQRFDVLEKHGVPFFFPFPVSLLDRLLTRSQSLSSGLLYVARKQVGS